MRETCASGSVGGEGGNSLVYPASMLCLTTWTSAQSKPLALVWMARVCWLLRAGISRRWLGPLAC
jgi:hypothetical protein